MSNPFTDKGRKSGAGGLNGVDAYGGTPGNDQTHKISKDTEVMPDAGLPKGVNVYGGTVDDKKGAMTTEFSKDTMPTAAVPKGVNEYFGTDNNEQTHKTVGGKWQ